MRKCERDRGGGNDFCLDSGCLPSKLTPVNGLPIRPVICVISFFIRMSASESNLPHTNQSTVPDEGEAELRDHLRRCTPATIDAAINYRKTGDVSLLPSIVIGIVQRFSDPELRPKLNAPDVDGLRLIDDLGIDSLTMMEIVMLVEEVTRMSISNDELRHLRSIGEIKTFIDCKARGVTPPALPATAAPFVAAGNSNSSGKP